jgi:hypothetical protein
VKDSPTRSEAVNAIVKIREDGIMLPAASIIVERCMSVVDVLHKILGEKLFFF